MQLASRFASRSPALRSDYPLSDDQIHRVAPSIFADAPHESRSERYAYIPTATVLTELRKEGFQPFMVTQTRVRDEGRREHTKHMIRLRHASQINGAEANEIVLLNSHDGTSSYQMLAGMFRFVCSNGLVCGDTVADVRVPHKGDVAGSVIEGAFEVLSGFDRVKESRDAMRAITLDEGEAAIGAAGTAVAVGAAATGVGSAVAAGARMAPAAARSVASTASSARSAYQAGSASAGGGLKGAAAGVGNVAKTGAQAAGQKVADGARSMKERMAAAFRPDDAPASGAAPAGPDAAGSAPSAEQPAWAKRLHRRQQLTHAATTAAHTLRGGDGGSSSQGPSLRDSDS